MNATNHDLTALLVDEERRYRARAVLAAGRPVFAFALLAIVALGCVCFAVAESKLPTTTAVLLGAASLVPSLMLEVWYLNRRLEAVLILAGLSR